MRRGMTQVGVHEEVPVRLGGFDSGVLSGCEVTVDFGTSQ
jgi:hypothetical protein